MTAPACKGMLEVAVVIERFVAASRGEAGQPLAFFPVFSHFSAAAPALLVLAAALVAAQPFFDVDRSLLGAVIGVGRHALGFKQGAGLPRQHAFGTKAEAFPANGGVAGIAAAKIFRRRLLDTVGNPLLEGHTDTDVPSRNAHRHAFASLSGAAACRTVFLSR